MVRGLNNKISIKGIAAFASVLAVLLMFTACDKLTEISEKIMNIGGGDSGLITDLGLGGDTEASDDEGKDGPDIAFIIPAGHTRGVYDKGWIQEVWEAISEWCEENGKTCRYYKPEEDTKQGHLDTYKTVIENGAELIFGCGEECVEAMSEAPWEHFDVKFVTLEATGFEPGYISPNLRALCISQQEAGWLAGNAAVREGYVKLGIISGFNTPSNNEWAWGYLSGVNFAARKYGVSGVSVRHHYADSETENSGIRARALSWYADGLDCIQCNAAGGNLSVISAAASANKPVFGAGKDQSADGPTVVTSMIVDRAKVISETLTSAYDGSFQGSGEVKWLGVAAGVARLVPWEYSRFKVYTKEEYQQDLEDFGRDLNGRRTGMLSPAQAQDINTFIEAMSYGRSIEITNL